MDGIWKAMFNYKKMVLPSPLIIRSTQKPYKINKTIVVFILSTTCIKYLSSVYIMDDSIIRKIYYRNFQIKWFPQIMEKPFKRKFNNASSFYETYPL